MEGDTEVAGPRHRLRGRCGLPSFWKGAEGLLEEEPIPLQGEAAGHEHVVVLQEFAERDQDLAEVRDHPDVTGEAFRRRGIGDLDEIARVEDDEGPFDRVAGRHRARLPRSFRLDLRPDRDEVVEDVHRCGMQGDGREARGPGPTVSEAEAAGAAGMAEDRSARDDILDEHLARFDPAVFRELLRSRILLLDVGGHELPPVDAELPDMLEDLRRFQAHAVRNHEAGAASDPVRLDPREVSEAADLRVLGPLPVDGDGTVRDDQRDFLLGGRVLEVLHLAVERNLFLEPLHLFAGGLVSSDAELPPDDVGDEDAEGLPGAARGSDRAGVRQVDVGGPVPVPFDLDGREALEGRHEDAFRQDREADADRSLDRLLLARRGTEGHLLGDEDRELFPVVMLRQFSDATGDAFDLVMFEQPLDPGGEVVGQGNLHVEFGVEAAGPGGPGDRVRRLDLRREATEVGADLLRHDGRRTHSIPSRGESGRSYPEVRVYVFASTRMRRHEFPWVKLYRHRPGLIQWHAEGPRPRRFPEIDR